MAFASPMIEDEELGGVELVAGGEAVCSDGGKEDAGGEKNDKRGGEALVVMDPREDAIESGLPGVRTKGRDALRM